MLSFLQVYVVLIDKIAFNIALREDSVVCGADS